MHTEHTDTLSTSTLGDALVPLTPTCRAVGLHRNTWRKLWRRGDAPAPVEVMPGKLAWKASDLRHFIETRQRVPVAVQPERSEHAREMSRRRWRRRAEPADCPAAAPTKVEAHA